MPAALKRALGRLTPTELSIGLAIVLACIGAAVGTRLRSHPQFGFGAEAAIAVRQNLTVNGPSTPALLQAAEYSVTAEYVAKAVTLPQIVTDARLAAHSARPVAAIAQDTTVSARPGERLVLVRVKDATQATASALADALAGRALSFAKQSIRVTDNGFRVVGDFEGRGLGGWTTGRARDRLPDGLRRVGGAARFGSGLLRLTCSGGAACEARVTASGPFTRGATYTAEGWIRSKTSRAPVVIQMGSGADIARGRSRTLAPAWRRVVLSWTPRADATSAELSLRARSAVPATVEIDGVTTFDPLRFGRRTSAKARRSDPPKSGDPAFRLARSAALVPATVSTDSGSTTLESALEGALGGLVVAAGAIAAGLRARRRRGDSPSGLGSGTLGEESKR